MAGSLKRVLVVAYYFPPMGLSGVQRVAKFVKYLPEYGWQPTVLTVEPGGYFAFDTTLLREVETADIQIIRTPTWDPTRLFGKRKTVSLPGEGRRRWMASLSQFLFVPDNKIGWMPHALRTGMNLLGERTFDAIYSTAPPYTAHLIAATLSRWSSLPLVLDYRDDWVGNPRHVYPTLLHRILNRALERWTMRTATQTLAINAHIRDGLRMRNPEAQIEVMAQGFDPADFEQVSPSGYQKKMRFLYSGIFYDAQTPDYFLQALARWVDTTPDVRHSVEAVFVGLLPAGSVQLIKDLGIEDIVRYEGYLEHTEAVAMLLAADVLWMTIGKRPGAEGISTSKLFEYFGARKPILALIPDGTARDVLSETDAAFVVQPDDVEGIQQSMAQLFAKWEAGTLPIPADDFIEQYDRKILTGMLARVLQTSLASY